MEYEENGVDNLHNSNNELTPELKAKLKQIELEGEAKVNKKDKKIGPLIAIIIILLLISVCAVVFSVIKKNSTPNTGNITENTTANTTTESTDITSSERSELYKRITILNTTNYNSPENSRILEDNNIHTSSYSYSYVLNLYKNGNYTADEKLYTLLYNLRRFEEKFEKIDTDRYDVTSFKKYIKENSLASNEEEFLKNITIISADYVAKRYEDLYGETIVHGDSKNMCGGFNYDKENNVYLAGLNDTCGGADFRSSLLHVYDIKKENDSYYVDMNAATIMFNPHEGETTCNIYNDIYELYSDKSIEIDSNAVIYKKCDISENSTISEYNLTDEDRESVAKYRYVFDDKYHFVKLEKI